MPVGKGSLVRASRTNIKSVSEKPTKTTKAVKKVEAPKAAETANTANTAKAKEVPKTVGKHPVAAAAVISSLDTIHEKKFEAISKIKCDIPTYLL